MSNNYFTQRLVNQDILDLNNVFPEKQASIKLGMNVAFGLKDIVLFLQQKSQNFTTSTQYLRDLDYAIKETIKRYYKSLNENNPFYRSGDDEEDGVDKLQKGTSRRDAVKVGGTQPETIVTPKGSKGRPQKEETSVAVAAPPKKRKKTKEDIELEIDGLKLLMGDDPELDETILGIIETYEDILSTM
jgi:hypothetical protein